MLALWFVSFYIAVRPWIFLAGTTLIAALSLGIHLLSPFGLFFARLESLKEATLPGGEKVFFPLGSESALRAVPSLLLLVAEAFALYACGRQLLRGERRQAPLLGAGALILTAASSVNALLPLGPATVFFLHEVAFLSILVVMPLLLSGEVIEARVVRQALEESERALQTRRELERLVGISARFMNLAAAEFDEGISSVLALLGRCLGAECARVVLLEGDGPGSELAYRWCEPWVGVAPDEPVSPRPFQWLESRLEGRDVVCVASLASLPPEAAPEKAVWERGGVRAFLGIPMVSRDRPIGFLGLYHLKNAPVFSAQVQALLRVVGEIFAGAMIRQRTRTALYASEQKYGKLFQQSREAILLIGLEGELLDANQAALDLFGYTHAELEAGLRTSDLHTDPKNREYVLGQLEERGYLEEHEIVLRRRDGTPIECVIRGSLVRNADGEVIGSQGIVRDVSQQKRLEEQLRQAQRMEAVGVLAGGLAHDFNNLLTGIGLGVEMLLAQSRDEGERRELLEISRSTKRAASLSQQLLAFSRRQTLERRLLDLNALVEQTLHLFTRLLGESIQVSFDPAPPLPRTSLDAGQMERVMVNLAVNARDAMPRGGRFRISTALESLADGHPGLRPGEYVVLRVADTGLGMEEETLRHIFDPFFTGDGHRKRPGAGQRLWHRAPARRPPRGGEPARRGDHLPTLLPLRERFAPRGVIRRAFAARR